MQREVDIRNADMRYDLDKELAELQRNLSEKQRMHELAIQAERYEQEREKYRYTLLTVYMSEIETLINKYNGTITNDTRTRAMVRGKTLALIRELDTVRKGQLIRFLYDAGLLTNGEQPLDLTDAELDHIDLSSTTPNIQIMYGLALSNVYLRNASFVQRDMTNGNFSGTRLTGANFSYSITNPTVGFKSANILHNLTINNSNINITFNLTTIIQTTTLPTILISFLNASFYSSFNFTTSSLDINNSLPICNFSISNNNTSIYQVTINQTLYSYDIIEENHGKDLYPGGHYIPKECRTEQRLALIICYRNREQHLKMFLNNIHPFLQKQKLDYTIFVVNQHGNDPFNRAALFNVGYLEAMKLYQYDCFIFHDVDLLPEDLRNIYKCGDQPRHMSVAIDIFKYAIPYSDIFGGVTAFHSSDILGINGHPTVYWGWGGEDDDMYFRVVKKLKKSIIRYPIEIARYKMIRTHGHIAAELNPHRFTILNSKYDYNLDGINTTYYTLHNIVFYKLFTLINVTLPEESFEHIRTRLHIKNKN
ncbi:unnamed protein product [Rotaria sordida]|uniref:Uncharacterized protein n=2 Tax=Rotaria sordida TaxID=392033 RepID=A0A815SY27_9BILA|nr:unnamed protein product [Rotaria sordida]CAF1494783.1 unnamed protein product [Rotaria sordida]